MDDNKDDINSNTTYYDKNLMIFVYLKGVVCRNHFDNDFYLWLPYSRSQVNLHDHNYVVIAIIVNFSDYDTWGMAGQPKPLDRDHDLSIVITIPKNRFNSPIFHFFHLQFNSTLPITFHLLKCTFRVPILHRLIK